MSWTNAATAEGFIASEAEGTELGDRRLEVRLRAILLAAATAPGSSFPEMCEGDAALEATYRFLSNERVSAGAILAPHFRATAMRARTAGRIVLAHDSTEFSFGCVPRGDLDLVGQGKSYGFNAHVALAVTRDEHQVPLGVLAVNPYSRCFGSPRLVRGRNKAKAENTMQRWVAQVRQVRARVSDAVDIVHVMDREADDYASLALLDAEGERFVIRQQTDRRLKRHRVEPKTRGIVGQTRLVATREVTLSARRKPAKKAYASRHPLRKKRLAVLEIRATRITIPRPPSAGEGAPDELSLNLVEVVEKTPPDGQEPVQWWLWTNEPIDTEEELLSVLDAYRARWCIEEYFKALKTGCRFEQRQLESRHALHNALAIFAPVAWRLLLLRSLARHAPHACGALALTPMQLRALRGYTQRKHHIELPTKLTVRETMLAVAKLGGHIANNGEPGWQVLGRGLDRLLDIELGLSLA
jgi:hypothetical protein